MVADPENEAGKYPGCAPREFRVNFWNFVKFATKLDKNCHQGVLSVTDPENEAEKYPGCVPQEFRDNFCIWSSLQQNWIKIVTRGFFWSLIPKMKPENIPDAFLGDSGIIFGILSRTPG